MPMHGPTTDWRPVFAVFATGRPDAVPASLLFAHADPTRCREVPGVRAAWEFLDECFSRRTGAHRPCVFGRAEGEPIDLAVQCYAAARGYLYLPEYPDIAGWGRAAVFRRDLHLVARSRGVVWFGPDADRDDSPHHLAQLLGIDCRVVRDLAAGGRAPAR
ncbi:hypothetical protein [Gemmata sp.]|uniref:hypothetical protein n=1 Tax=Gemmata sp. TaxID=1914242 RepID=UPI003F6E9251